MCSDPFFKKRGCMDVMKAKIRFLDTLDIVVAILLQLRVFYKLDMSVTMYGILVMASRYCSDCILMKEENDIVFKVLKFLKQIKLEF